MRIVERVLIAAVLTGVVTAPGVAQGRGATGRGGASQAQQRPDTTKKSAAVALDFQDQDLKVVLDAIAAAGQLNVSLSNIPQQRVTVHLGQPVPREQMAEVLKGVAESHGLKVTMTPTLIQIAGTPQETTRQPTQQSLAQQLAAQNQQQQVRLFILRLRHASAVQLAPVLQNMFAGFSGTTGRGGTTTVIPNGRGGFTFVNPQGNVAAQGTVTTIDPPFTQGGGRGGGRGNAAAAEALAAVTQRLQQQITGALSSQANEIRIIAEESSNSLLIRATEPDYQLIQQVVQGVDLRPLQVLVEVTIAQVQRTHDFDLGVSGTASRTPKGRTQADVSIEAPSAASARDFILELVGGKGTVDYDVALAALQARGDVRVLSLPVIIAQNNRQAVLNVGSSRPFVQVSQSVPLDPTSRVQTVQYIDVATVLTITPTINPDGYVNLQVTQTDNSATNEVQFDAPVINKREATTQVFIKDGQTTVIGGLADNARSHEVSGIPFLSRIPLLGPLIFGRTTRNETRSELFLFLTPHIISSDEDIDRYREALRGGSDLLKQINIGPRIVPEADTLKPAAKPDSTRPDSLQTLRRRPPQ